MVKKTKITQKKALLSIFVLCGVLIVTGCVTGQQTNWYDYNYKHLIDKSVITHSGETVGTVINQLNQYESSYQGLLQPYLEPYSSLCNVRLQAVKGADKEQYRNILDHYPIGSEQPAWVALFREGHYQLFYNNQTIRVFLKGDRPLQSFNKHLSVVRHPIRDVIHSNHQSIKSIEVYVFKNNYSHSEISLNTTPLILSVEDVDLSAKLSPIDLESIEEFFNHQVILEAMEISGNDELFLYGKIGDKQTIAGNPVSISDIAVVYRSVFHHWHNAPYISLDNHEDNRYAKVNFGGHLQNTHVGSVVLEADKLFKTLSTGLDPNTLKTIIPEITRYVPDFLTEDERRILLAASTEGHKQIRYWFYPDNIGTLTDGTIAVVDNWQFYSDAERMDARLVLDDAVRNTIDHLNNNYEQYEKAVLTFQELGSVGRIMALVIWLKEMNLNDRIDLDALLSVKIPAYSTPEKTKKMLVLTTAISYDGLNLNKSNIRDYTQTFNLSHLLDNYPKSTSDKKFLEIALEQSSALNISGIYPEEYRRLTANFNHYEKLIDKISHEMKELDKIIERRRITLSRFSSEELNQFNSMIEQYNNMATEHKTLVINYNAIIEKLNQMDFGTRIFSSVGGGISLEPRSFKKPVYQNNSSEIEAIRHVKPLLIPQGKVSKSEEWLRSNFQTGEARINPLPEIAL